MKFIPIAAMTLASHGAFAAVLSCDLEITIGPKFLCDIDRVLSCTHTFDIDLQSRQVVELPKMSSSLPSPQVVEKWSEDFIVFSHWRVRGESKKLGINWLKHRVTELNRVTGAIRDHEEYRDIEGRRLARQEVEQLIDEGRRDLLGPNLEMFREGKCLQISRTL